MIDGIRAGDFDGARAALGDLSRRAAQRLAHDGAPRAARAEGEGVIVRVPGRGTFVSPEKPRSTLLETQDIAEEIRGRGAA